MQRIARTLTDEVNRPSDLVARYGGEEFVVLLPETTLEEAGIVAERIRKAIEDLQIPHAFSKTSTVVTSSLGIASIIPGARLIFICLLKQLTKPCIKQRQLDEIASIDPNSIPTRL